MSDLHPETGVRVRLDLRRTREDGATYGVTLFFTDSLTEGSAEIPAAGPSEIAGLEDAPDYAKMAAKAFLRQTQSAHRTAGRWPRRVLRWRAPK